MKSFLNIRELLASREKDPAGTQERLKRMFICDGEFLSASIATGEESGNALHTHPSHDQLIIVLEGGAEFRIGEETRHVGPGDIVFIPQNILHGRVRKDAQEWAALSVYGPFFDRSKTNLVWDREQAAR